MDFNRSPMKFEVAHDILFPKYHKIVLEAVWPDLAKFWYFYTLSTIFEGLFNVWQNFEPTLAN